MAKNKQLTKESFPSSQVEVARNRRLVFRVGRVEFPELVGWSCPKL